MVGKNKRGRKEERGRRIGKKTSAGREEARPVEEDDTYAEALKTLLENTAEPESWQKHSIAVSGIASEIADALLEKGCGLDAEYVAIGALLHDIGRRIDCGTLHGWEGFRLLQTTPFRRYSEPCITHWLKGRSYEQIIEEGNLPSDLVSEIISSGSFEPLSLEDKVICVADAMARGDEIVSVKNRYEDARERYGTNAWISTNEKLTWVFKNEIDRLLGKDLYSLFPDLSD